MKYRVESQRFNCRCLREPDAPSDSSLPIDSILSFPKKMKSARSQRTIDILRSNLLLLNALVLFLSPAATRKAAQSATQLNASIFSGVELSAARANSKGGIEASKKRLKRKLDDLEVSTSCPLLLI
jgi:hypothetical protein